MTSNAELLARRGAAIPRGLSTLAPFFAARAENAELWDVEGRRYIDFAAGIAVLNVGHRHPKVMAAIQAQLEAFTHTAFQVVGYDTYVELAERLNALAPFSGPAKTVLFTTGGEAVENAVKIARIATGRSALIAFSGGFHGRTLMGMALTGKVAPYKKGVGPMPPEVFHAPFPSIETGVDLEQSLRALDFLFSVDVDPSRVAAIIVEPVQGEGGFHVASDAFMRKIREICDAHGILLIVDEIQTGFARTGKMFAVEHTGVEPDLVTVAKALGGGMPLSGVIGRSEIMDAADPGGLGGTYGGSPVACAAALAVLDIIEQEGLIARATQMGAAIGGRISGWIQRNDLRPIRHVRAQGAMVAFDVVKPGDGKPDGAAAKQVVQKALEGGLIALTCGAYGESVRLLPPLTTPDAIIDEGLDILEGALALSA